MLSLIGWAIFGLIAGGIARLLVPGPNPLGCLGTIALGIAGSILGGFLGELLFHGEVDLNKTRPAEWIMSIATAVLLLLVQRWATRPRI